MQIIFRQSGLLPDIRSKSTPSSRFQASSASQLNTFPPDVPYRDDIDGDPPDEEDTDLNARYAHQQQSLLLESQDRLLDGISTTVSTLKNQAGVMGREILDQVGLLDDVEGQVNRSQGKLERANQRMKEFVRKNKSKSIPASIYLSMDVAEFVTRSLQTLEAPGQS